MAPIILRTIDLDEGNHIIDFLMSQYISLPKPKDILVCEFFEYVESPEFLDTCNSESSYCDSENFQAERIEPSVITELSVSATDNDSSAAIVLYDDTYDNVIPDVVLLSNISPSPLHQFGSNIYFDKYRSTLDSDVITLLETACDVAAPNAPTDILAGFYDHVDQDIYGSDQNFDRPYIFNCVLNMLNDVSQHRTRISGDFLDTTIDISDSNLVLYICGVNIEEYLDGKWRQDGICHLSDFEIFLSLMFKQYRNIPWIEHRIIVVRHLLRTFNLHYYRSVYYESIRLKG